MEELFSLTLEAVARRKPAAVIMDIENAARNSGSWITDHTAFPDRIQNFVIETEPKKLKLLFDELSGSGLDFVDYSREQVALLAARGSSARELRISLNVKFVSLPADES
jgi:hypothetical protein